MYQHRSYTPLSNNPEAGPSTLPFKRSSWKPPSLRFVSRPKVIFAISIIAVIIILLDIRSKTWIGPVYVFDKEVRPEWLDSLPVGEPLSVRVAVISHPSEVERRQLIRNLIFKGVPSSEVELDYRFFVGSREKNSPEETANNIWQEAKKHNDMEILDMPDIYERVSEKRYAALKWADSFSNVSYDYFMTMDSDTFVRFKALTRRIHFLLRDRATDPRRQAIMIGRMKPHSYYWLNRASEEDETTLKEDSLITGPRYSYPAGIGYLLSSFLAKTLLSARPEVPHHIHYPHDDVMIGSWIASLSNYADPDITFRHGKHSWNIFASLAHPVPLHPYPIDTLVIDDPGWHDFPGRKYGHKFEGSIGWNSVCIHHIRTAEIPMFRNLEEFREEWKESDR